MARLPAVGRETYRRVGVWACGRIGEIYRVSLALVLSQNEYAAVQQNSPAAPKNSVIFAG